MKKLLVGFLSVFLVVLIGIGGYLFKIIDSISNDGNLATENNSQDWQGDPEDLGVSENSLTEKKTGAVNILLMGTDRRNRNENGRTDAMMIATLDKKNGQIKLASIMRDTYVSIPDRKDNRINAAFAFGGPKLALQTVNQNFNLNITRYVTVDFFGLEKIINALGGIEIDVQDREVKFINSAIKELNRLDKENKQSPLLTQGGLQNLDGKQAVAYSRIRYVGDGDSERTERQRRVMTKIFHSMRTVSPLKLPNLIASIIPFTDTNIPISEIISLGTGVLGIRDKEIYQYRVPAKDTFQSQTIRGMAVYVPDLERNTELLHEFLYEKVSKE